MNKETIEQSKVDIFDPRFFKNVTGKNKSSPRVETTGRPGGIIEKDETNIGFYDSNNGMLAFVDENGDVWVGPYHEDSIAALKEAGYKEGSFHVPHSNDMGGWKYKNFPGAKAEFDILNQLCLYGIYLRTDNPDNPVGKDELANELAKLDNCEELIKTLFGKFRGEIGEMLGGIEWDRENEG